MPTYDYHCPKCGTFEVVQSIKDAALTQCPTCKSKKIQKLVASGGGVIFTGSGFWETDYNRSKDYSSKKKADASPAAKPAESKPAPATPAK
ncbi:MAG: zinc ribbon domain-containing protein [Planctomycetes bacterium]|nr:zinc ribbon domain-containing protein [Planctomycetota bacterium]